MLVVSLKHLAPPREEAARAEQNVDAYPSPWFVFGKSLDALLLDHTDYDIDRMQRMNRLIQGGIAAFGDRFLEEINKVMVPSRGLGLRHVEPLLIRPSRDIGRLAAEHGRAPRMQQLPGLAGRLFRYISDAPGDDADLLSYLLFDGEYARELIELGHHDARAREEELADFFTGPASQVASA
jgi:NTE family protein